MLLGSNGKTSTTELIYNVLTQNGYSVGCNLEGSNQTEGVTTAILNSCNLKGEVQKDALVIESDERYLRHTLKFFTPSHLVITNLYRDQMTRNGNPEIIYNIIKEAYLEKITHLILNADDPLSGSFGFKHTNATYFGMNETNISKKENDSVYDDGIYCPICHGKLEYSYHNYSHIGSFKCTKCEYKRANPQFAVTDVDLKDGKVKINNKYELQLSLRNVYTAYNVLAAFAVSSQIGIKEDDAIKSLSNYVMKNDRVQEFEIGEHKGMLLTSKHENSIAYNQSISYVINENKPCTVVVIVDQISRKYFTSETSWLWDIDFEKLNSNCVEKVILAGKYIHDLKSRFEYSDCDMSKVDCFENLDEMMNFVKENAKGYIYLITCFTDRYKFINRI